MENIDYSDTLGHIRDTGIASRPITNGETEMNDYIKTETAIASTQEKIGKGQDKLGQKLDRFSLMLKELERKQE